MNRLVVVIWLAVVALVAVVTGCDRAPRYDSRLVAADSLMQPDPDSALALVEAVAPGSLTGEADRAYRRLLLTQGRYRCYVTATSDSDINRALDYYRQHDGEREKLTRAFIYKGAVMEELGHPDSAMHYYKTAETTADEKDYINLGQINTRIADLYRRYYADSEICFEKYNQALHYYKMTDNQAMQLNCLFNMANCSADSAVANYRQYYQQAYNLAVGQNDSANIYKCREFLCRHLYSDDSTRDEAKMIALDCINHYQKYANKNIFIDLAFIYAEENNPDSASYYLSQVDASNSSEQVKMRYYWALAELYKNRGDTIKSNYYSGLKSQISDSIDNNRVKNSIQRIENLNNGIQESAKSHKVNFLQTLLWGGASIALVVLLLAAYYYHRRMRHFKSIIKEMSHVAHSSDASVDTHADLLEQIGDKDSVIGRFVQSMVTIMQSSIEISEKDTPAVIKKRIRDTISIVATDEFWSELRAHLDRNSNNMISEIGRNPKINDSDLKVIELTCCGFDYLEIAVALGYAPNYISTKRKRIAKKMGLKVPIQEYLANRMKK